MNLEHRLPKLRLEIFVDGEFARTMFIDLAEDAVLGEVINDPSASKSHRLCVPLPLDGRIHVSLHLQSKGALGMHDSDRVTTYFYDSTTQPPTFRVSGSRGADRQSNQSRPDEPRIVE